ncbi:probetacellulin [Phyllobates terribilis]|uniref:probetacellulin n=1 Tax=Phyllobates terribilis TaxID=111132 RepID=UPI003CCAD875
MHRQSTVCLFWAVLGRAVTSDRGGACRPDRRSAAGHLPICSYLPAACMPQGETLLDSGSLCRPGADPPCARQATLMDAPVLLTLVLGFIVFPWVSSDGNSTTQPATRSFPCPEYIDNCSGISEPARSRSHFSRCPKSYRHYCVKGKCRFVMVLKEPACICEEGYTGSRCERLDLFYLKEDRGQLVVIGLILAMVALIIVIVSICIFSHHCRKAHRRKMKGKEMESLSNEATGKMEETHFV